MASRKKQTETTPVEEPQKDITQQLLDSFERGKIEGQTLGQQAVYRAMAEFVSQRMLKHFESRNDELAKELREILLLIKQNIQQTP
jgi:DNA-binding ferritin-like protein (Dps family)